MIKLPSLEGLLSLLQKCNERKDLTYVKRLHARICSYGLELHANVGSHMLEVYVACGSVAHAQQVLGRLSRLTQYSLTYLISTYNQCGGSQLVLDLYQTIQQDSVDSAIYTYLALLKTFARLKDLETGRKIHVEVSFKKFERDICVGSALIDMYAKCGSILEAQKTLDILPVHNVVSWNALIAGYAECGLHQGLKCLKQMQTQGISPDMATFVSVIKACRNVGDIDVGLELHMGVFLRGFEVGTQIGNSLVHMYSVCMLLDEAHNVFNRLTVQNVVSWSTLLMAYSEQGFWEHTLDLYHQMHMESVFPDAGVFVCVLKACRMLGDVEHGREIHREVVHEGLEGDLFVASSLVNLYAKCGSLVEAEDAFNEQPNHNVVSWTALIEGYAENGQVQEVLKLYEYMQLDGVNPDAVIIVCILGSCSKDKALNQGQELHTEVVRLGFERDSSVCNTLIDVYAQCGLFVEAHKVFDSMKTPDVVTWSALIAGYAEHEACGAVFNCFEEMKLQGLSPNVVTYSSLLKVCASVGVVEKGQDLHVEIVQKGYEGNSFVANGLIDVYAKSGLLREAQDLFEQHLTRDVISWNALIAGYTEQGSSEEALTCFDRMQFDKVHANVSTFACALKACSTMKVIEKGHMIEAEATCKGFERDPSVSSSLINMYAKHDSLSDAKNVFDRLPIPGIVDWNALVAGYAEHEPDEALECFHNMFMKGASGDAATLVCIFKACGNLGALEMGREVHGEAILKGFENNEFLGATLLYMYAKCGSVSEACDVFEKLPQQDIVSWNAMIKGCSFNHGSTSAVRFLDKMQDQGLKPHAITFACLLSACSHSSLIVEGQQLLKVMKEQYTLFPSLDHLMCMIDLLARSGQLYEACKLFDTMPFSPSAHMWTALLSACKTHAEVELGLQCFSQLVQMNPESATPYVLMTDIYANSGEWDHFQRIKELQRLQPTRKLGLQT